MVRCKPFPGIEFFFKVPLPLSYCHDLGPTGTETHLHAATWAMESIILATCWLHPHLRDFRCAEGVSHYVCFLKLTLARLQTLSSSSYITSVLTHSSFFLNIFIYLQTYQHLHSYILCSRFRSIDHVRLVRSSVFPYTS